MISSEDSIISQAQPKASWQREGKRSEGYSRYFVRNKYYPLESTSGTKLTNYNTVISCNESYNEIKFEQYEN